MMVFIALAMLGDNKTLASSSTQQIVYREDTDTYLK